VIDLNCDLGEDPAHLERDIALLEVVTSANIACGGHAGDEATMSAIVRAASTRGCGLGAHPGYPDPANFGRVELPLSAHELEQTIYKQIVDLQSVARSQGAQLTHVKPHGGLYHAANHRPDTAAAIAHAVARANPALILIAQSASPALSVYTQHNLRTAAEAFADRVYEPDGTLRARSLPGALITDAAAAAAQAVRIARGGGVCCSDGSILPIRAGTICIHSDTPGALEVARAVRAALIAQGIGVSRLV
jgi:5-oxoprolinase (ATP-hydrolysing) subunit A